jgi:microcystin degradation protein MlrC
MNLMKIGILGFIHESNSFVKKQTKIADFSISRGGDILNRWRHTHHEIGGFIQAIQEKKLGLVPFLTATATPSGTLTRDTYEALLDEMTRTLSEKPVDGLLLALHGAMVAEGYDDADGNTAKQVREELGADKPIIMTLDCHANISKLMVENVDATILYRSNPHVDQFDRGIEAVALMERVIQGKIHPVQYLEQVPLVINISKQNTGKAPLLSLISQVDRVRSKKEVLSVSFGLGFAFSDVEKMGTSIVVVTDDDRKTAKNMARYLGRYAWNIRDKFLCELPSPTEAVKDAGLVEGTVVLMDVGDNVGGGSPGNSTVLLREVLDQGLEKTLVILTDPEAVQECLKTPIGESLTFAVGAKQDSAHETPIEIHGILIEIHDGVFTEDEPRHGGQREFNQGSTAVIKTAKKHVIILNSIRTPPFSLNQITSLGIDPQEMKIIIAKGVIAPIAAYEPISEKIIVVNTLGSTSANIHSFNYRHRRFPLYPLEINTPYNL